MKSLMIGVIYVAYQTDDLLARSLTPWTAARRSHLGGHSYVICAVSVPFEGFDHSGTIPDNTLPLLVDTRDEGYIDAVIASPKPMRETDARGRALAWLAERGCDTVILVDSDEMWTEAQIAATFAFVVANPWIGWFRIAYQQIVFTPTQWLAEPFTPPRIHRVHQPGGYRAAGYWQDNNLFWRRPWEGEAGTLVRDVDVACLTVPQEQVWVRHETWLSDDRGRRKSAYQALRWQPPAGAGCSFAWDDARGGLVWNEEHFRLTGQPIPEIVSSGS